MFDDEDEKEQWEEDQKVNITFKSLFMESNCLLRRGFDL